LFVTKMSSSLIDSSDGNLIPSGSTILYRTSGGYFGKLEVVGFAYSGLVFNYVTFDTDGSIIQTGSKVTIAGSYTFDLDNDGGADFQNDVIISTTRNLAPRNGARFYMFE